MYLPLLNSLDAAVQLPSQWLYEESFTRRNIGYESDTNSLVLASNLDINGLLEPGINLSYQAKMLEIFSINADEITHRATLDMDGWDIKSASNPNDVGNPIGLRCGGRCVGRIVAHKDNGTLILDPITRALLNRGSYWLYLAYEYETDRFVWKYDAYDMPFYVYDRIFTEDNNIKIEYIYSNQNEYKFDNQKIHYQLGRDTYPVRNTFVLF